MNACQTFTCQDFDWQEINPAVPSDFLHARGQHKTWGSLESNTLKHQFFGIHELKADFNNRSRVCFDETSMLSSMNICIALDGHMSLHLHGSQFSTSLSALKHHFIYAPETEYSQTIDKSVRVVHITIDKDYYAGLLPENEPWADAMKMRLNQGQQVWSGTGNVNLAMNRALYELMNNPLQGRFRELFSEAKILELVALQLAAVRAESPCPTQKDRDIFHDLRCYLDTHFNDDLSLRSLSRTFGLNEFKLKKGFKTFFNHTIFDYIHEQKMLHARKLLLDDNMLVNEVAGKVGYKNPNHFSTAFKRRFGVVPTALK